MDRRRNKFISTWTVGLITLCALILTATSGALAWDTKEVIKKYLNERYPWPEFEISEVFVPEELPKEPPQKITLVSGPLGRAVFSLGFRNGEKKLAQVQISAFDYVVATRRPIKQGQVIEKEDIYLSLMDVRRMPKEGLTRLESGVGKVAVRNLEINMPVTEQYLGNVPVIKKGQRVTLIFSAPGLKITTQGEAREDGHTGRQMRVVNLYSNKDVRGVPLDDSRVLVVF